MARTPPTTSRDPAVAVGLQACSIVRPPGFEGEVQIVTAPPALRAFPLLGSPDLGVIVKHGAPHAVVSDGRRVTVPCNALIVRPPGCVWSMEATLASFVCINIGPGHLPKPATYGPMSFCDPAGLPNVHRIVAQLQRSTSPLHRTESIGWLIEAILSHGFATCELLRDNDARHAALQRAKEFLQSTESYGCTLDEVARTANLNKFARLRQFRRSVGTSPHAFGLQMRVSKARTLLARGMLPSQVAAETGWADQSHFGRHFKRTLGLSPVQYARAVRSVHAVGKRGPRSSQRSGPSRSADA